MAHPEQAEALRIRASVLFYPRRAGGKTERNDLSGAHKGAVGPGWEALE